MMKLIITKDSKMVDEKKYNVVRYFDTYPESIIHEKIAKNEAETFARELNSKIKHKPLTEYLVRQS